MTDLPKSMEAFMNMEYPKPCPKCGNRPRLMRKDGKFLYQCNGEDHVARSIYSSTVLDAVRDWNSFIKGGIE